MDIDQILKQTKVKCGKCGLLVQKNNIKKHYAACDGIPILRNNRKKGTGKGRNWKKGKTDIEVFGKERAKIISSRISTKLKDSATGRGLTEESEKLRRLKIAKSMKGNKNGASSYRAKHIEYNGIVFRSGWEVLVAQYLDEQNIDWKYEDVTFDLSETTSYTPDFAIYENEKRIKFIEVKGYFRKENKQKFEQFKSAYPNIKIEIWDKKVLLEKGFNI